GPWTKAPLSGAIVPANLNPPVGTEALIPAATSLREWLVGLCQADSTTGREDAMLPALEGLLGRLGARVEKHAVAPGRTNVLALWGEPRVLFSTHLDTVPPFIPPSDRGDRVHGRGTCDAKGQIVAHLATIARLRGPGESRLAWLGVVGEEAESIGARAAMDLRGRFGGLRALINGEPTENRLATGQRGWVHYRLRCRGRAAHSGTPELGRSATWA